MNGNKLYLAVTTDRNITCDMLLETHEKARQEHLHTGAILYEVTLTQQQTHFLSMLNNVDRETFLHDIANLAERVRLGLNDVVSLGKGIDDVPSGITVAIIQPDAHREIRVWPALEALNKTDDITDERFAVFDSSRSLSENLHLRIFNFLGTRHYYTHLIIAVLKKALELRAEVPAEEQLA